MRVASGPDLVLVALLLVALPHAAADEVRFPDRESTYPIGVTNITHAPWGPTRGDDVVVRLTLADGTPEPRSIAILYCRIEPNYACALPVAMVRSSEREWSGEIPWERAFMGGSHHIGYNLTLRFAGEEGHITAPRGNHWVPEGYPTEVDGSYYFYTVSSAETQDGPVVSSGTLVALLIVSVVAARYGQRRA